MRYRSILYLAALIATSTAALAQFDQSVILPENSAKRVSDHVYAIMGFPNIAIVVGSRATLVVDTGMGARNGQIIAREVEKLSKNQVLYLTTTHFHPEHAAGEPGFPAANDFDPRHRTAAGNGCQWPSNDRNVLKNVGAK